jgi:hypothetical protein
MLARNGEARLLFANLAVFVVFGALAFARNTLGLFDDFDGRYMLVEVLNRLTSTQPSFAFSNDFLQSIGNIQFLQNPWPLVLYWPISWFSDFNVGKVIAYLFIAVIVFLSGYGLARLLSQGRQTALTAGWILGIVVTPFVPYPFFCPILALSPTSFLLIVSPVVGFWLMRAAGRSTLMADVLAALGLFVFLLYLLAVSPPALPLLALGAIPYAVLVVLLTHRRSELVRKLVVLTGVIIIAICLRWPWYLLGLFSYTAPHVFPGDFTVAYQGAIQVSILFQGALFGWAGPVFVATSAVGALLSLRDRAEEPRLAAYVLLAVIASLIGIRLSFFFIGDWLIFPPFYVEIAVWPLYGTFSAVALQRAIGFATAGFAVGKIFAGIGARAGWLLPVIAVTVTTTIALSKSTPDYAPFPPRVTTMVDILKSNVALVPGSSFNGRVATIIPVDANGAEPVWQQQLHASLKVWRTIGNDQMSIGLWYYRIPTLFEYNQFLSPVFHALVKRTLQRPVLPHVRNIEIFSHANARVLRLLGVRYVILPQEESPIGVRRATEEIAGQRWGLFELPAPNLATYSPTSVEIRQSLASTLDFVADDSVDLTKAAVVREEIGGPLTVVASSSLSTSDGDLHVVAQSPGRSLLVVPVEFSHCMELRDRRAAMGGPEVRLVRADGVLTGIVFERELDAVLAFRTGPLHSPTCRWKDYQELQTMLR